MNPHNWNLAKFPSHKNYGKICWISWFVLIGIFNHICTITLLYKIWLKIPIRGRWRGSLKEVKMKQILGQNSEIVRWLLRFIFLKVLNTKPDMSMLETFASFLLYSSTTMYLFCEIKHCTFMNKAFYLLS